MEDKKNMEAVENTEVEKVEPNIYIRYKDAVLAMTNPLNPSDKFIASGSCDLFDHNVREYTAGNSPTFYGPEELKETVPWEELLKEYSKLSTTERTDMMIAFGKSFPNGIPTRAKK